MTVPKLVPYRALGKGDTYRSVRIVILTTGLSRAGAETQLVGLATRLKSRGWDVRVISMLPPRRYRGT